MARLLRKVPLLATVLTFGLLGGLPSAALAVHKVAPPGNSGVTEYEEDLPTSQGQKPTSSIVVPPTPPSSGGSSGSSGSGGSTIPRTVVKKLDHSGTAGKSAAALALATASAPAPVVRAAQTPEAPATSVVKALAGTTGAGGLGGLLPVLLFAALIIISAVGILQRRRST